MCVLCERVRRMWVFMNVVCDRLVEQLQETNRAPIIPSLAGTIAAASSPVCLTLDLSVDLFFIFFV